MSRRAALLLRASVVWTVWVWIVLVRNMIVGNFGWSFKLIHIVLAVVSLAFAVVTWHITTTSRRFAKQVERERNPRPDRLSPAQLAVGAVRLGLRRGAGAMASRVGAGDAGESAGTSPSAGASSSPGEAVD